MRYIIDSSPDDDDGDDSKYNKILYLPYVYDRRADKTTNKQLDRKTDRQTGLLLKIIRGKNAKIRKKGKKR